MRSAKLTMAKFLPLFLVALGLQLTAFSQENSPYSRYGLGDISPNRNVFSRGMGGIAAGVADNQNVYQSLNYTNPASYANIFSTVFDVGAEIRYLTLRSSNPAKKFTSANTFFSYLQMAFPLTTPKMAKKKILWAATFGLRPTTRINYKIERNERLPGIDSLNTVYEGSGGLNQAYLGTALKIKNFSIGVNAGYIFGSKDYSTKLTFLNDSVIYYISNSANKTSMNGVFVNLGVQYEHNFNKDEKGIPRMLRVGAYGNLQQNLNASRDDIRETITYDGVGAPIRLDSIFEVKNIKGKVTYPAKVGAGFTYQSANWMYGADFETTNWSNYRYYGQTDLVQNSWTIRVGTQYYPAKPNTPAKRYFRYVKYRAGFYYGNDYIKVDNNRPDYAFTLGAGLPLTSLSRISYAGEYVVLNTALEVGNRGNRNNNIRESNVRFNIGISMNARWFQKPKYN